MSFFLPTADWLLDQTPNIIIILHRISTNMFYYLTMITADMLGDVCPIFLNVNNDTYVDREINRIHPFNMIN